LTCSKAATGQARLLSKRHAQIKKTGLSATDNIRALDHMFVTSLGWSLKVYEPKVRMEVGRDLVLEPENAAERPLLILVPDELKTGLQSCNYFWERLGLRGFTGRDPHHRDWNDVKRACERAGLWGHSAEPKWAGQP
jgi:hypothetical protein